MDIAHLLPAGSYGARGEAVTDEFTNRDAR